MAIIKEDSVVALSGAMPGLVGATMRRDGFYANLRGNITHQEILTDTPKRVACIRVKIFNILLPELGPDFLRRGIILGRTELTTFLKKKTAEFWQDCSASEIDDEVVAPAHLCEKIHLRASKTICLRVQGSALPLL